MAKKKRPAQRGGQQGGGQSAASAARRLGGQQNAPGSSQGAQRRYDRSRKRSSSSLIGWGAVALVVLVVIVLVVVKVTASSTPKHSSATSSGVATGQHPALAPKAYVDAITTIPTSVYNKIGIDGQSVPFVVTKDQPSLTKDGKVRFLYEGAEYCPYCAMMRYALIAALSRFGTFSNLKETSSGSTDSDVPTFSFLGSTYTSPYLEFTPLETLDRQEPEPQPLQPIPAEVAELYKKYDGTNTTPAKTFNPGSEPGIPFLDIDNRFVSAGDPEDFYDLLASGAITNGGPGRMAIADGIHNPDSTTGKYVEGAIFIAQANYLSAAICAVDGNKPAAVCNSSGVQAAAKVLSQVKKVG